MKISRPPETLIDPSVSSTVFGTSFSPRRGRKFLVGQNTTVPAGKQLGSRRHVTNHLHSHFLKLTSLSS